MDPAGKLLCCRGADMDVTKCKAADQLIQPRQRQQTGLRRALEVEVVFPNPANDNFVDLVELFGGGFVRADIREMQRRQVYFMSMTIALPWAPV